MFTYFDKPNNQYSENSFFGLTYVHQKPSQESSALEQILYHNRQTDGKKEIRVNRCEEHVDPFCWIGNISII